LPKQPQIGNNVVTNPVTLGPKEQSELLKNKYTKLRSKRGIRQ